MGHRTPLYDRHLDHNARMVDFSGWDMPVHYGSLLDEHHAVRHDAGVFDVSHMTVVDISGGGARDWLRRLLANDVDRVAAGRALYSAMLNPEGGVIDDLIVYRREQDYRLVVNCGTREKDLNWMTLQAEGEDVVITERPEMAMLAIQGPRARDRLAGLLNGRRGELIHDLKVFAFAEDGNWMIARTGYTGEDGVEIMLPGNDAVVLWMQLMEAGIRPCGLGARDTLRLEAGFPLFGQEFDENSNPLCTPFGWVVKDKPFYGRDAMWGVECQRRLVGIRLLARGIPRTGYKVLAGDDEVGVVTSGVLSPLTRDAIAFAWVRPDLAEVGQELAVEIRGQSVAAQVVDLPFHKA